jgi:hypothetical protein
MEQPYTQSLKIIFAGDFLFITKKIVEIPTEACKKLTFVNKQINHN